jgi:hypothetical protein
VSPEQSHVQLVLITRYLDTLHAYELVHSNTLKPLTWVWECCVLQQQGPTGGVGASKPHLRCVAGALDGGDISKLDHPN